MSSFQTFASLAAVIVLLADVAEAQEKSPTQETRDRNFGIGAGALVPTHEGGSLNGGVEGNFYPIYGEYLVGNGGGGGLRAYSTIWRFKVQWIGLGIHFYRQGAEMLSAESLERTWDIQPSIGTDLRVWNGLSLRFLATWSLASPVAVYHEAKKHVDGRVAYGRDLEDRALANPNDPAIQRELMEFQAKPEGDVRREVQNLLEDTWVGALKRPSVWVGVRYAFDIL
jgi:hypothetical protein